jgi:hypothetical protein
VPLIVVSVEVSQPCPQPYHVITLRASSSENRIEAYVPININDIFEIESKYHIIDPSFNRARL